MFSSLLAFSGQAGGLISLECCSLVWGFDSEKIQGIVQGGGMSDWFRVLCVHVEILNEAVMLVWGWRASCPAASWASFCCGGLTEPKEEAHFRVIYCHPNTSCLLRGLRKALATPFLSGTSSPCKRLRVPPLTCSHIHILIMYLCASVDTHVYV